MEIILTDNTDKRTWIKWTVSCEVVHFFLYESHAKWEFQTKFVGEAILLSHKVQKGPFYFLISLEKRLCLGPVLDPVLTMVSMYGSN